MVAHLPSMCEAPCSIPALQQTTTTTAAGTTKDIPGLETKGEASISKQEFTKYVFL